MNTRVARITDRTPLARAVAITSNRPSRLVLLAWALMVGLGSMSPVVVADQANDSSSDRPFRTGGYVAPMGSFVSSGNSSLGHGLGGVFAMGYRQNWFAIEAAGIYTPFSGSSSGQNSPYFEGGDLSGLLFPIRRLPDLYVIATFSGLQVKNVPSSSGPQHFSLTTAGGGLGYMLPLHLGNYEFGIRAETQYQYGKRDVSSGTFQQDVDAPHAFHNFLVNFGLQLPLGRRHVAASTSDGSAASMPPASSASPGPAEAGQPAASGPASNVPPAQNNGAPPNTAPPTDLDSILGTTPDTPPKQDDAKH